MEFPVQISFHDIPKSEAVDQAIRKKVEKLKRFCQRIISCKVTVEQDNRRHQQGNLFRIRVQLIVPAGEIVAGGTPDLNHAHEDIYVAIRDTFAAAQRRLQDHMRRYPNQRRISREVPAHAKVVRLLFDDGSGYGFLETSDGREIYFNRKSVLNNHFDDLRIGTEVRFSEEMGGEGPQASTVEVVGRDKRHFGYAVS